MGATDEKKNVEQFDDNYTDNSYATHVIDLSCEKIPISVIIIRAGLTALAMVVMAVMAV